MISPAMNTNMYENPILQRNINTLKELGYNFVEPESGRLACGDTGKGKLASPETIVDEVVKLLSKDQDLKGKSIIVTAGPTIESIDPMRYITNRSTGKMGYSIAKEAIEILKDKKPVVYGANKENYNKFNSTTKSEKTSKNRICKRYVRSCFRKLG